MFVVHVLCHLWDLADEGVERALDVIQGRIGATGICVPLTAGITRHVRLTANVSPRWFTSRGGVFFQPDRGRYASTRCQPIASDWLRGRDPFAGVVERCRKLGLMVRARFECTNLGRIAERYPFAARKNVFGDPSPSQVCLANPDVVALFRALASDVCANHAVDTLELVGLDAMWPPTPDTDLNVGLGGRQLMALCFCESCRQSAGAAGVDVQAAVRSTTVRLEKLFRSGRPIEESLNVLAADDIALAPFIDWYRGRIAELFRSTKAECRCRIASYTRTLVAGESLGADGGYTAEADIVACDWVFQDVEALMNLLGPVRSMLATDQQLEVQLRVAPFFASDPQALVRLLTRAAELEAASATLDCYGHIPEYGIEVVKQAIRFARRTSS